MTKYLIIYLKSAKKSNDNVKKSLITEENFLVLSKNLW